MNSKINVDALSQLKQLALLLMQKNAKQGILLSGTEYFYTCPNTLIYNHQWFWDSCFHIMINCHLGQLNAAEKELQALLYHQQASGHIGHMMYWEKKISLVDAMVHRYYSTKDFSDLIQPAFLAHALHALRDAGISSWESYLEPVSKYYRYLHQTRVFRKHKDESNHSNHLITIIHPWESGMDNVVAYDAFLKLTPRFAFGKWMWQLFKILKINARFSWDIESIVQNGYFAVEDPLVNSVYGEGLKILAELWQNSTQFSVEIVNQQMRFFQDESEAVMQDLAESLWDPQNEIFGYRDSKTHQLIGIKTVAGLSPLIFSNLAPNKTQSLLNHLSNPKEFWPAYPIPSTALDEPGMSLSTKLLWRGPSWISTNWYIWRGLKQQMQNPDESLQTMATELRYHLQSRTLYLLAQNGFHEYYHPHSGIGHGANGFGWSMLGLLMDEQLDN